MIMKKIVLVLAVIAFVGILTISCKCEKKEIATIEYVCPMECEEDKTYTDKDAKCPVCKMALVEKKEEVEGGHEGHGHEH